MKLEQKHIAKHLPFGLMWHGPSNKKATRFEIDTMVGLTENLIFFNYDEEENEPLYTYHKPFTSSVQTKPVFHPMSDINKQIENNGQKFVPHEELNRIAFNNLIKAPLDVNEYGRSGWLDEVSNWEIQKLIEWHFNVDGLPDESWVDVNTLDKNPY